MPRRRFAIITYDPDLLAQLSIQAGGEAVAFGLLRALRGERMAYERGIINVSLLDPAEVEPGPVERWTQPNPAAPQTKPWRGLPS